MNDCFVDLPDGRRLCYRVRGAGPPVVLIIGLGLQLTAWPEAMLADLADRGFQVITFDNRDVGRSSRMGAPPPTRWRLLRRKARAEDYCLRDMAGDVEALFDALGIAAAHVVGMSMGGMIAQTLAAHCPDRVLSLTSIFSTTGARSVGQPSFAAMLRLMRASPTTEDEAVARHLDMLDLITGDVHRFDAAQARRYASEAWRRGGADPHHGVARQIMAIMKSGDRTASLSGISAPTLVLHGDRDPLVHPSGGIATARAIPGARHKTIRGMGHDLAPGAVPELVAEITRHIGEPS
ncbi:MAG: alpha/beta fold hydrolase [Pseudomonadota bacterium]